jgi:hypothetical protein
MSFEDKVICNIERTLKNTSEVQDRNSIQMPTDNDNIEVTAKVIKKVVPSDRMFEFNGCVDYVTKKTNLNGDLLKKGIVKGIDKKLYCNK